MLYHLLHRIYKNLKIYRKGSPFVSSVDNSLREYLIKYNSLDFKSIKFRLQQIIILIALEQILISALIFRLFNRYNSYILIGSFAFVGCIFLLTNIEIYLKIKKIANAIIQLLWPPILIISAILITMTWWIWLMKEPSYNLDIVGLIGVQLIHATYSLFCSIEAILVIIISYALGFKAFLFINFRFSNFVCKLTKDFIAHCIKKEETEPQKVVLEWISNVSWIMGIIHFSIAYLQ